jgi:prepilin-type processing-associated H-X9-DG protein
MKNEYVFAHPRYEHAHASQWFSQFNQEWGWVGNSIKNDIQLDRHFEGAHYLYADGHVELISAGRIEEWIAANFDFARPE